MPILRALVARSPSPLSAAAREYRAAMFGALAVVAASLVLVIAGARGRVPLGVSVPAGLALAVSTAFAVLLGVRGHRRALADRELQTRRTMLVTLAAALGRQDDDTLRRIAARGGPEGEAAELILAGRREGHRR